jgi:hypothetical protein
VEAAVEHWIEPQELATAQRTGYDSPLVPGMTAHGQQAQHYVNRPGQLQGMGAEVALPNQAPQHYVNRPGQLQGVFDTVKSALPHVLFGVALGYFVVPWAVKKLKKGR